MATSKKVLELEKSHRKLKKTDRWLGHIIRRGDGHNTQKIRQTGVLGKPLLSDSSIDTT